MEVNMDIVISMIANDCLETKYKCRDHPRTGSITNGAFIPAKQSDFRARPIAANKDRAAGSSPESVIAVVREARDLLAPVYGWFTEGFDT
jgi:hypothetical protein